MKEISFLASSRWNRYVTYTNTGLIAKESIVIFDPTLQDMDETHAIPR